MVPLGIEGYGFLLTCTASASMSCLVCYFVGVVWLQSWGVALPCAYRSCNSLVCIALLPAVTLTLSAFHSGTTVRVVQTIATSALVGVVAGLTPDVSKVEKLSSVCVQAPQDNCMLTQRPYITSTLKASPPRQLDHPSGHKRLPQTALPL